MKKIQLLIVSLSIILVLGCLVIAILYFTTGIFKTESNKENFNKYIAQMDLKEFINLEEYNTNLQRMQEEPYLREGEISITVDAKEQTLADEKFEYSLKVDPSNEKASAEIDVIIDGENELTIDYLANEDLYGIRFRDIINQYIVLENNNLGEFVSKLGLPSSIISDKIEIPQEYSRILNSEEIVNIFSKYAGIILNEIPEENYGKIENGYTVKINSQDFSNIMNKVIEEAKQDEELFDLIIKNKKQNYYFDENQENLGEITFDEYQEMLEGIIFEEIEENIDIEANVYVNKKETVKIEIKCGEILECSIEKRCINMEFKEENLKIIINKNGDNEYEMNCTIEAYEIPMNVRLVSIDDVTFNTDIEIDNYDEINHAIINNFSGEQIQSVAKGVINLLVEKTNIENGILGRIVTNIMTGDALVVQTATEEDKKNMIYEAIALAKAGFLSDYYSGDSELEISEQRIKEEIEEYIQDISVNVTKNGDTHEYIITVDGMELDEDKSKLDLSFLDS